jgi:redox-sensitive bicupin YhaK (pirin superfamily)
MAAVTVPDPLQLPAVGTPGPDSRGRRTRSVTTAPRGYEGEGFPVKRAFAGVPSGELDPFIHMDEMGEVDYGPGEPKGTSWHPHRGFETVTYMLEGIFEHQDSTGGGGVISNGATQWMTAGGGILHIERPPESLVATGGLFHGVQLWVNLPAERKMVAPRYQDLDPGDVTLLRSPDGGAVLRVIAGELDGHRGPGSTYTPINYLHASVAAGARLELPWPERYNALAYVLSGSGTVGADAHPIHEGQLAVLGPGGHVAVEARRPLEVLLLGGAPIGEPVAWYGPFVMNTQDELRQAFDDFQAGRMGQIPTS